MYLKPLNRGNRGGRGGRNISTADRRRRNRRRVGLLTVLSVVFVFAFILSRTPEATSKQNVLKPELRAAVSEVQAETGVKVAQPSASSETGLPKPEATLENSHEIKVRSKDTLYTILRAYDVPSEEILRLARLSKKVYNVARIKPGDTLKVTIDSGGLRTLEYMYSDMEGVLIEKDKDADGGFAVTAFMLPHTVFPRLASGVIENSLFEDGLKAGLDPNVILNLSDIFAWDIDFATELRKGDNFHVLYETLFTEGKPERTGRILAAEMTVRGKTSTAIYFRDTEGRGDYYDSKGKSLSRTLLKSPLRYRRISSYFSKKRYHPILKKYRAHHGVDYAAPTGTPIESAGDGRVVFAGWKSGYGKFIKVRHNSTYTTAYGHLSRISKGVRKGARVRQGQVIGKVGSTGISTGPHLHYEVHIRGSMVNPLRVKSKSRKSLKGDDKEFFARLKTDFLARFNGETAIASLEEEAEE